MIEALKQWDQSILLWINKDMANPFFDSWLPVITDLHKFWMFKFVFVPVFVLSLILYKKYWGSFFSFFLVATVGLSDMLGGQFLKPLFERLRPSVAGLDVILRAPHFGGFSFPSNHALNMFTIATFISLVSPRWSFLLFFFAGLIAFSRVYCGVHYPSDVFFAALIGMGIGFLMYRVFRYCEKRFLFLQKEKNRV